MTDAPPPPPDGGTAFCGECGSPVDPEATFCGECGTAQTPTAPVDTDGDEVDEADDVDEVDEADEVDDAGEAAAPTAVIERVPEPTIPPPPPPAATPIQAVPTVPPPPAPAGAVEEEAGKGKGPKVLVALLLLVVLVIGALVVFGGDDGGGGDDTAAEPDDPDDEPDDPDDGSDDPDATTTAPDETSTTAATDTSAANDAFVSLVDDTGRITVEVPADWTDVELAPDEGTPRILAAPDAAAFETGFEVPGLDLRLIESPPLPEQFDATLDTVAEAIGLPGFCTSQGKDDYAEGAFSGRREVWADCAEIGTQMVLTFARQDDGQTVFIGVQLTAADDPGIADRVAASVSITG